MQRNPEGHACPGKTDELVDAHSDVQERGHYCVRHRPGALSFTSKSLAFGGFVARDIRMHG
jgi:hypothetical protein